MKLSAVHTPESGATTEPSAPKYRSNRGTPFRLDRGDKREERFLFQDEANQARCIEAFTNFAFVDHAPAFSTRPV